jgi:hypothetical protein
LYVQGLPVGVPPVAPLSGFDPTGHPLSAAGAITKLSAISTFSIAILPQVRGRMTAQQDLGEQTDLRQNPEKFHDRWSHTYSAQMPLFGKVPQPLEHRWPVYRQAV